METEQDFFDNHGLAEIGDCYDTLLNELKGLPKGAFILQIGWGSGYNTNTITQLFTDYENASGNPLMDIRKRFRLGQSRSSKVPYYSRAFPKTRRIFYRGKNPISPFGWVKISPLETAS